MNPFDTMFSTPAANPLNVASLVLLPVERYVRIFVPASLLVDGKPTPVRWSVVAAANKKTVHPAASWELISGLENEHGQSGVWDSPPPEGHIPAQVAKALIETFNALYPQERVVSGAIYPWVLTEVAPESIGVASNEPEPNIEALRHRAADEIRAARINAAYVTDEQAEYVGTPVRLLSGPVGELLIPDSRWARQPANLLWSDTNRWFVAAHEDFPSVYVGGAGALIDSLLARDDLEALEVYGTTGMTWEADTINQ